MGQSQFVSHIKCYIMLQSESNILSPSVLMLTFLSRFYVISIFYVLCTKWLKIVVLYCSISISTNEMVAFGVIQSHGQGFLSGVSGAEIRPHFQ